MTKANDESSREAVMADDAEAVDHPPEGSKPKSAFGEARFDTASLASILIALAAQTALAWPLLRWQDVVTIAISAMTVIFCFRSMRIVMDEDGVETVFWFFRRRIRWHEADSLKVQPWFRVLRVQHGRREIRIPLNEPEHVRRATWILERVGDHCRVDPRIAPLLRKWCDPAAARRAQWVFLPVLMFLALATAWAVWRTATVGGITLWIPAVAVPASFVLFAYRRWIVEQKDRQLLELYMVWTGISAVSMVLVVSGETVSLVLVGVANFAAMLGAVALAIRLVRFGSRSQGTIGDRFLPGLPTLVVFVSGAMVYLTFGNPYRHTLAKIEGVQSLDYAAWDAATGEQLVAASRWLNEDRAGLIRYRHSKTNVTRELREVGLWAGWPCRDGRSLLFLRQRQQRCELWLADFRLQNVRRVAAAQGQDRFTAMWSPSGSRFLYAVTDQNKNRRVVLVERKTLKQSDLAWPPDMTFLGWNGEDRVWTCQLPEQDQPGPVAIREVPVIAGGPAGRMVLHVEKPCKNIFRGSQPGIFVIQTTDELLVADALQQQVFPWLAEWGDSLAHYPPVAVLPDRRRAVIAVNEPTAAVLLVDWRTGRSVTLWRPPDRTYRIAPEVYLSEDATRVLTTVSRKSWGLEFAPKWWVVVSLPPRTDRPRWIPLHGLFAPDGPLGPGLALRGYGPWLDVHNLLLPRFRYSLGVPGFIRAIQVYRVRLE
ncbi:MAG: hypothetical protein GXP27_22765 [Planctomycetes bacterium]|nr:hypothetical protein [Planctomycetota bacterium]